VYRDLASQSRDRPVQWVLGVKNRDQEVVNFVEGDQEIEVAPGEVKLLSDKLARLSSASFRTFFYLQQGPESLLVPLNENVSRAQTRSQSTPCSQRSARTHLGQPADEGLMVELQ
jgi:hypothetical protein